MRLEYRSSFSRDLRRVRDAEVRYRVLAIIEELEAVPSIAEIPSATRIKSDRGRYYRIRIGDYRLGVVLQGDMLVLVRFLHRRDIYRFFP